MSTKEQTNNGQENVQTYELTTNITKKDVTMALVMVFVLLATALGISCYINRGKEHKIETLKQAMRELEWEKEEKICDSLYQVTDIRMKAFGEDPKEIDARIQERIDNAEQDIWFLRDKATQQISKKYPLTKFFTSKELTQINEDITARATNCLYPDSTYCKSYDNIGNAINDVWYQLRGENMIDNPLASTGSVYDFETHMQILYNLEIGSGKFNVEDFYVQVPNKNPLAMMHNGKLSFTNPAAQKLYAQYQNDIGDIDKKYIFNNPKFSSHYCEYSAALNKAYEDREKLRQIGDFFNQQYQHKTDSLNSKLHELTGKVH